MAGAGDEGGAGLVGFGGIFTIMVGGSACAVWCIGVVLLVVGVVVWVCFGVRTGVFGVVLGVRIGVLGG